MSKFPKVNYIGNKAKIIDWILSKIPNDCQTMVDLFSGGNSVSYALKQKGYRVISNDMLFANYVISKAIIENNEETLLESDFDNFKHDSEAVKKKYSEINYLSNNLYYDYEVIELAELLLTANHLNGYKRYLFLSLLRRAMIRKIPYSRMNVKWEEIVKLRDEEYSYQKYGRYRSYHNKPFIEHIKSELNSYNESVFNNLEENKAYQKDALRFSKELDIKVDLVYLDPPYPSTMNNYVGFYGVFDRLFSSEIIESLDLTNKNSFKMNLGLIIEALKGKTKYIAISLNNKSKPGADEIKCMLANYSNDIKYFEKQHTYQITGKSNKNENYEILLLAKLKK